MTELHPENVATLLVVGGLCTLLLRQLLSWRLDRGRSHLPWVLISVSGIAFGTLRILHLSTLDPDRALQLTRAQYVVGLILPGLAVATMETLGEVRHSRATWILLALVGPLGAADFGTSWFVSGPAHLRHDGFGHPFYAGEAGPGLGLLLPLIVWTGVILWRRARQLPPLLASTRWGLRLTVVLFVGLAVHDSLMGAGAFRSVHLFEYGYLTFALVATGFEAYRTAAVRGQLTASLHQEHLALVAKARSLDEARADLDASTARYQQLADATSEGVLLVRDGRIAASNAALHALLASDLAALHDRVVLDLFVDADRPRVAALLAGRERGPLETQCRRPDGTTVAVAVNAAPAAAHDARVLLLRDLSRERDLQQRLIRADRLASLGTLAAGTAHEINNPLTFVMGNAELLHDELARLAPALAPGATDDAEAMVRDLDSGAARIRRVVEQLLVLARDEATAGGPIDVGALLELSLSMASHQLRHRAQVVRAYGAVPPVFGNEARLGQVFLNLIVNAAQAIPEGHASQHQVRVATRAADGKVIVEITDTGAGMTPEVRARIFSPYFTTKPHGQGTGLGLSISLGIVTGMGGVIDVTSAPGHGTTVCVELPAMAAALAVAPARAAAPPSPSAPDRKVLVIDDEELVALTVARMLAMPGTEIAHSGRDALARAPLSRFDAIVCDLMMPDMTGIDLFSQVTTIEPALASRFVFLTGGVFTEEARAFLGTPGRRWLSKPVSRRELRKALDEITGSSPATT